MEWREQSTVSCEVAFTEAQRWVEEVTKKIFGSNNFRSALENGVLLCDLINKLKPGIIKRVNRLSTPIAGLDNVNVFLKACGKLGLNESQLFHPGDLQDVSTRVTVRREETNRRLKNVLITIYWLGRKAQVDPFYTGPQLNLRAFEGLLGIALSKALEDAVCPRSSVRDSGFGEGWYPDRDYPFPLPSSYRREDSVESLDSMESRTLSIASDLTLRAGSEDCGSDAEEEQHCFRMSEGSDAKSDAHFLPSRDRGCLPAPLRRNRGEHHEDGRGCASPLISLSENGTGAVPPPSQTPQLPPAAAFLQWAYEYQSESDSDGERLEPDLVHDDLASRRFRCPSLATPVNFAVPPSPRGPQPTPAVSPCARRSWVTMSDASRQAAAPAPSSALSPLPSESERADSEAAAEDDIFLRALIETSDDSDDDQGHADPVQDDLYARKVELVNHQTSTNSGSGRFLPKHWTPEEDVHVRTIQQGSRRRPWYRKMQGFRPPLRHSHCKGSKSMNDILEPQDSKSGATLDPTTFGDPCLDPAALVQVRQEQLQRIRARVKESEVKWQDVSTSSGDLSRWKSRRRSANSDLHRKREERDQLEIIADGGLREVQEEREQEASPTHHEGFLEFALDTRAPLTGSLPPDKPNPPGPSTGARHPSQPPVQGERAHAGPPASERASGASMPGPMSASGINGVGATLPDQAAAATPSSPAPVAGTTPLPTRAGTRLPNQTSPAFLPNGAGARGPSVRQTSPGPAAPSQTQTVGPVFPRHASPPAGPGPQQPGLGALLGAEPSRAGGARVSATLPRGYRRSEGSSRLSTGVTPRPFGAKPSRVASLPRLYAMDDSHKSLLSSQRNRSLIPNFLNHRGKVTTLVNEGRPREEEEKRRDWRCSAPLVQSFVPTTSAAIPAPKAASLPKLASANGEAKVRHSDMRVSLNQRPNKDFGFQTHWDSTGARVKSVQPGSPAELCQLQAGDEILAVGGRRVAEMSYKQWKGGMDAAVQRGNLLMDIRRHGHNGHPEHCVTMTQDSGIPMDTAGKPQVNGQPVNGLAPKAMNGGFRDDPVAIRNKGGSESAISDLQVPSISTSSRWSWDAEEERRRQEKWQQEQDRLLQEKYRRDQERLDEEWRRAQQEAAGQEYSAPEKQRIPEVTNGNGSPSPPPPFSSQSTSLACVASNQHAEEPPVQRRQVRMEAEPQSKTAEEEECDGVSKRDPWPGETYSFAKLSPADRTKSKSSPALDGLHKQETRGSGRDVPRQKRKGGAVSQVEQERLEVLEEMRKRTQLLTDSSWIRQRTAGFYKEPITVGTPIRRYESLDNLHTAGSWARQSTSNPTRPHSALGSSASYRAPGRHSMGAGYSTLSSASLPSSSLRQNPMSRSSSTSPTPPVTPANHAEGPATETRPSSQQRGSASAAGPSSEGPGQGLRSESDTDSCSVTHATADSESISPIPSELNALEQIEEETPDTALKKET